MLVKNINGTTSNICKCGSWLEHWKRYSGQAIPSYCPVRACYSKVEVGAHVQKDSYTDSSWYIVPLCQFHNAKKGESLEISDAFKLVPANISLTCSK
jgi:uncharacterized GH25 family protein